MRVSRLFLIILLLLALGVLGYLAWQRFFPSRQPVILPVQISSLVPSSWTVLSNQQCDVDGDVGNDPEWIVLYRYDGIPQASNGFIGGVVFTAEVNRVPQQFGTPTPYRPAFLVPYKLLPDVYAGKGQGYLGDVSAIVQYYPAQTSGPTCSAQEIYVTGYGYGQGATRLSIFRWDAQERRYQGLHFSADAYVTSDWNTVNPSAAISRVTTANRFNDRSSLCAFRTYRVTRTAAPRVLLGTEELQAFYTIDFCQGAPPDPAYPEGVVVEFLRNGKPVVGSSPTGANFLMPGALDEAVGQQPALNSMQIAPRQPYRILEVRYVGAMEAPYPGQGEPYPTPSGATGSDRWWQAAETATVYTTVVVNGQPLDMTWSLRSIANERVAADTRWRIYRVTTP